MDQKANNIYKQFSDTLYELRNSIADSLQYNVNRKTINIGETAINFGDNPYAILGFGKSSSFLIDKLCSILPTNKRIFATCFCQEKIPQVYETIYSEHPIPNEANFNNTKQIINRLKTLPRNSILIIVKSGGGSSMFSLPEDEVSYKDKILINQYLLESDINCRVINDIRKAISKVKGGKLLNHINASSIVNIIISDDVLTMNEPHLSKKHVASGPSVPQAYNGTIVYETLSKSTIWENISVSAKEFIESLKNSSIKNFQQSFQNVQTHVVSNNKSFINLFSNKLKETYKNVIIRHEPLFENVNSASNILLNEFITNLEINEKMIYIAGGEVTCNPPKKSKGGRCQHFASTLIPKIAKLSSVYCFALATDGEDYIKNVGGAYVSDLTLNSCLINKLDHTKLTKKYNSNKLLSTVNCIFESTPYSINLGDIYMICKI